jgi:hypothetical protein
MIIKFKKKTSKQNKHGTEMYTHAPVGTS